MKPYILQYRSYTILRHILSQNYVILQEYNVPHITSGLIEKKAVMNSSIRLFFR